MGVRKSKTQIFLIHVRGSPIEKQRLEGGHRELDTYAWESLAHLFENVPPSMQNPWNPKTKRQNNAQAHVKTTGVVSASSHAVQCHAQWRQETSENGQAHLGDAAASLLIAFLFGHFLVIVWRINAFVVSGESVKG